jgi:hypothetical protein
VSCGRDSGGLAGGTVACGRDSGGLGGGTVACGRDSGGLRRIVASRRVSAGTGGAIDGSRRDSTGLRGRIEGFGRVGAFVGCGTRLLGCILGSNGCKAFLFRHRSRQVIQVEKTLLPGSAEAFLRKKESKRFWAHEEQYLESISDVEAIPDVKGKES